MDIKTKWKGLSKYEAKIEALQSLNLRPLFQKNMTEMFNRAANRPWTPIQFGELRNSRGVTVTDKYGKFGYTKEYAPHVEYGHRTASGGYVPGRFYLKANYEKQKPIFINDCKKILGDLK